MPSNYFVLLDYIPNYFVLVDYIPNYPRHITCYASVVTSVCVT